MASLSTAGSKSTNRPLYVFGTADQRLAVRTGNTKSSFSIWQCKRIPSECVNPPTILSLALNDIATTSGKLYLETHLTAGIRDRPKMSAFGPAQVRAPAGRCWESCTAMLFLPITASYITVSARGTTTVYAIEAGEGFSSLKFKAGKICVLSQGLHLKPERTDTPLYKHAAVPGPFTLVVPEGKKLSEPTTPAI